MKKTNAINLLPGATPRVARLTPASHARSGAHVWGRLFIVLCSVVLVVSTLLVYRVVAVAGKSTLGSNTPLLRQLQHLVLSGDRTIRGEKDDRINILLLGIGGPGHQGAYLTDTIIIASLKPSTNEVAFLSIPRDLYVDIPGLGFRKINNANAFGRETNYPGGGEQLTADVVAQVTGLPIHYYARIDFMGFVEAIDRIGGVTVTIDRSFVDPEYPTANFGYQTVSFRAGEQKMDGKSALVFVRSRHGSNGEGSDFSRSKRQQKILLAVKDKTLSPGTMLNPLRINDLLETVGNRTKTNMELQEIVRLAWLVQEIDTDRIVTAVLDTRPTGLLISSTTPDGAAILMPRAGDFSEIQLLARNLFLQGRVAGEQARVAVQNGTGEKGVAEAVAKELRESAFTVVSVSNAKRRDIAETIIVDFTGGEKPYTRDALRERFQTMVVNNLPLLLEPTADPSWTVNLNAAIDAQRSQRVDLLIVVGADRLGHSRLGKQSATKTSDASS